VLRPSCQSCSSTTAWPFYDLLSTVTYPELSPKLAMKIARRATLEEIGPTTWPAFAEDIGLAAPFVRRRVAELAETALAQATSIPDSPAFAELNVAALRDCATRIVSRAERVARTSIAPASSAPVARAATPDESTTRARARKLKGGPRWQWARRMVPALCEWRGCAPALGHRRTADRCLPQPLGHGVGPKSHRPRQGRQLSSVEPRASLLFEIVWFPTP